mmetsp:Transcript_62715/g.149714  ORF Transcript_62715/g.149714 Transcript_62715/m.149714 type:complete len:261 (-) Transcript_62715:370-1152(-)
MEPKLPTQELLTPVPGIQSTGCGREYVIEAAGQAPTEERGPERHRALLAAGSQDLVHKAGSGEVVAAEEPGQDHHRYCSKVQQQTAKRSRCARQHEARISGLRLLRLIAFLGFLLVQHELLPHRFESSICGGPRIQKPRSAMLAREINARRAYAQGRRLPAFRSKISSHRMGVRRYICISTLTLQRWARAEFRLSLKKLGIRKRWTHARSFQRAANSGLQAVSRYPASTAATTMGQIRKKRRSRKRAMCSGREVIGSKRR